MFPTSGAGSETTSAAAAQHTAVGLSVPSGVPDQPLTDASTLRGAYNRAVRLRELEPGADFWIGIEGGVDTEPDYGLGSGLGLDLDGAGEGEGTGGDKAMQSFAWVVVLGRDANGRVKMGKARTATYYLPRETAALVRGGMELGHADEVVFGQKNSKQQGGSVGLLTGNVVDRRRYYEEAVVLALIPFRNGGLSFD
jgi:inosine/xanthosine triphosphatase